MHRSHLLGGGFFIGGKIAFVKFAPAKFFRPHTVAAPYSCIALNTRMCNISNLRLSNALFA